MAHHEIQALTDLTTAPVALENQLGTLKQKSGLGRMLLGGKLLKPAVKIFGNAQIHCHTLWYQNSTTRRVGMTRYKADPVSRRECGCWPCRSISVRSRDRKLGEGASPKIVHWSSLHARLQGRCHHICHYGLSLSMGVSGLTSSADQGTRAIRSPAPVCSATPPVPEWTRHDSREWSPPFSLGMVG